MTSDNQALSDGNHSRTMTAIRERLDLLEVHVESLLERQGGHRNVLFPESVEKGIDYGEVDAVMVDADIFGWASRVAGGEALVTAERLALGKTRGELANSLHEFPKDARPYYKALVTLASAALSAASGVQE